MSTISKLRINFLVNDEDHNPGSPITPPPPLEDEDTTRREQGNAKRRRRGGLPVEYLLNPDRKNGTCVTRHTNGNGLLTETVTPTAEYVPSFTPLYRHASPRPVFKPQASSTVLPPLRKLPLQFQAPQSPLPPLPQLVPLRLPSVTLVHESPQSATARALALEAGGREDSVGDAPRSQSRCEPRTPVDDQEEEHAEGYAKALEGQRQGRGSEQSSERRTLTGKRAAPENAEQAAAPPMIESLGRSLGSGDQEAEVGAEGSSRASGRLRSDGSGVQSTSVETEVTRRTGSGSVAVPVDDSGRRNAQGRRKGRSNGDSRSRPYACSSCEKRFHQQSGLDSHVRVVHLKERRFECPQGCGLRFGARGDVTRHVDAVHLKKRDWVCYICGDAFSRKSILTRHCWNVHKVAYRENSEDGGESGRG